MTSLNIDAIMRRSGMRADPAPAAIPAARKPSSLLLIADRALEACGAFEPSPGDAPELAAAKALKRAALNGAGRLS